MQIFLLRNLVSVSFAAILLTAIAQRTIAGPNTASKQEASPQLIMPETPESNEMAEFAYQDMLADELAPLKEGEEFMPSESPQQSMTEQEKRVLEKLNNLKEGDDGGARDGTAAFMPKDTEPTPVNYVNVADDETYPPYTTDEKSEPDNTDPTDDLPTRKGGRRKGIKLIPIIRMGEPADTAQSTGLTVIKAFSQ